MHCFIPYIVTCADLTSPGWSSPDILSPQFTASMPHSSVTSPTAAVLSGPKHGQASQQQAPLTTASGQALDNGAPARSVSPSPARLGQRKGGAASPMHRSSCPGSPMGSLGSLGSSGSHKSTSQGTKLAFGSSSEARGIPGFSRLRNAPAAGPTSSPIPADEVKSPLQAGRASSKAPVTSPPHRHTTTNGCSDGVESEPAPTAAGSDPMSQLMNSPAAAGSCVPDQLTVLKPRPPALDAVQQRRPRSRAASLTGAPALATGPRRSQTGAPAASTSAASTTVGYDSVRSTAAASGASGSGAGSAIATVTSPAVPHTTPFSSTSAMSASPHPASLPNPSQQFCLPHPPPPAASTPAPHRRSTASMGTIPLDSTPFASSANFAATLSRSLYSSSSPGDGCGLADTDLDAIHGEAQEPNSRAHWQARLARIRAGKAGISGSASATVAMIQKACEEQLALEARSQLGGQTTPLPDLPMEPGTPGGVDDAPTHTLNRHSSTGSTATATRYNYMSHVSDESEEGAAVAGTAATASPMGVQQADWRGDMAPKPRPQGGDEEGHPEGYGELVFPDVPADGSLPQHLDPHDTHTEWKNQLREELKVRLCCVCCLPFLCVSMSEGGTEDQRCAQQ